MEIEDKYYEGIMYEDYAKKQDRTNAEQELERIKISNIYKEAFKSKHAIDALNDLESNFLEHPSYLPGWNLNDVCYLEGQKSVVEYIKRQIKYKNAK